MRILLLTATYPPSTNGVAIQTQLLSHQLQALGHSTRILAPKNHRAKKMSENVINFPSIPNPFIPSNYPVGVPLVSMKKIVDFNPEIIHTHHPFIVGKLSETLAKKFNSPLFFTHHTNYDNYTDYYIPIASRTIKKYIKSRVRRLAKKCSKVICPTREVEAKLNEIGVLNTAIIPNGINVLDFQPSKIKYKQLSLIFVGRLEPEKNPLQLVKLIVNIKKVLPNVRLTITGTGTLAKTLKKSIAQNGLEKNINVTGNIDRNKLPKLISKHHFFISLSTSEVMPLTYLEAQACGLPTIILKKGVLDFLNSSNSLFVSRNMRSAASQIMKTYAHTTTFKSLSKSALKNAQQFSINHTAKKYIQLYNRYI